MEKKIQKEQSKGEAKEVVEDNVKEKKAFRLPYGLIGKALLGTVAVAGVLVVAGAAPNIFQVVKLFEKKHGRKYQRYQSATLVRKEITKLVRKKLIVVFEKKGELVMRLTEKGRQELLRYQLKEKRLEKRSWDKKWRLIIFDIEETKRARRDGLRQQMHSFGFAKLQDSVWVYPYECEEVISLLKAQYHIGKELLYIVAGEIEGDEQLKKKFSLK